MLPIIGAVLAEWQFQRNLFYIIMDNYSDKSKENIKWMGYMVVPALSATKDIPSATDFH